MTDSDNKHQTLRNIKNKNNKKQGKIFIKGRSQLVVLNYMVYGHRTFTIEMQ